VPSILLQGCCAHLSLPTVTTTAHASNSAAHFTLSAFELRCTPTRPRAQGLEKSRAWRVWRVAGTGEPRTTRDVDVVVSVAEDTQAEALVLELQAKGFRVLAALEEQAVHRLATVRMAAPGESEQGVVVDLLFASSGIESEMPPPTPSRCCQDCSCRSRASAT
jgi:hypothetical protein